MKNLLFATLFVLAFSFNTFADLVHVPLKELVKKSDLIVVGTLQIVSEEDKQGGIIGIGTITIEEVIAGNIKTREGLPLKPGDRLRLSWNEWFACVYGWHKRAANEKGIWLLTVDNYEVDDGNYPGRFVSLNELGEVKRFSYRAQISSKSAKRVAVQNTDEQVAQEPANKPQKVTLISSEPVEKSNQYSPMSAFLVFITALIFFRVFYRDRYGW